MIDFLLSPLSWILFAIAGWACASRLRRCRRFAQRACIALAFAAILGATPLGANLLVAPLERAVPSNCTAAASMPIVVLAGGSDRRAEDALDAGALGVASLRRLLAASGAWHATPERRLVIAGGPAFAGALADSLLMRTLAQSLGVPAPMIDVETASTDTWENAQGVAALLAPPQRIVLVTSALHMPRARFAFERAGFEVCALPTDPRWRDFGLPGYLIPQLDAASKTRAALHEWVGLAWYHLLAWKQG